MRLFICFCLFIAVGGCTTAEKNSRQSWSSLFEPDRPFFAEDKNQAYDQEHLEKDYVRLGELLEELDELANEMAKIKRNFALSEKPYLTDKNNEEIQFLMFRYLNAQDALWQIADYYRSIGAEDTVMDTKGAVLGMSAGLNLGYYSSKFIAFFVENNEIIQLINSAHPRYEIQRGMFDQLFHDVTSVDNLEFLQVAWYLIGRELADKNSRLSQLQLSDPLYNDLIKNMDRLHADTLLQTKFILYASRHDLPNISNRLRHSRIVKLGEEAIDRIGQNLYKARGILFKKVARIKRPNAHLTQFSEDQVQKIKAMLEPGDILLTYTAGYLGNIFLPGTFKHGITYIGTVNERRRVGLVDDVLAKYAVSKKQSQELIKLVNYERIPSGHEANIIEAVAEGVRIFSLDELLETHINYLLVLRPKLSNKERLKQLISTMQYVGVGYDFNFDFIDDTNQSCMELIYRTIGATGAIDLSLVDLDGRWVLEADNIVNNYLAGTPDAFDFVLFAEETSKGKDYNAVVHTGHNGKARLRELMAVTQ